MNDVATDPWAQSTVNVGVYGCTRAGKTRFLFQLLQGWSQAGRILSQSPGVLTFLNTVTREIDKHQGSMPTVSTTPDMAVTVREGNNTAFQFIFRDLRGELLSSELDDLDRISTLKRDGVLNQQVKKCDAFLFFFDPASSEDPHHVERHHEREIKRARRFIEYILRERGNEHLPIVFVQTHRDAWQQDPRLTAMATEWRTRVNEQLRSLYESHLRRYCPESLTDPLLTSVVVSSVQDNLDGVVDHVRRLVNDSRKFRAQSRNQSAKVLAAGILALAALVLIGGWLVGREEPPTSRSRASAALVPQNDDEAIRELLRFESTLARHPTGSQLAESEEAEKINHHLRWLNAVMQKDPESGANANFSATTIERMRDRYQEAASLVAAKATATSKGDLAQRVPLVALYLAELPQQTSLSEELAESQMSFWAMARALIVEELAKILKRRDAVSSPPVATLRELILQFEQSVQDVQNWAVFGTQERSRLVEELRTSKTFCELLTEGAYDVTLTVEQAFAGIGSEGDPAWRNIVLRSPGVPDQPTKDGIHLRPGSERNGIVEFSTKQATYRVTLGLGTPVFCDLAELTEDQTWTRVHDFNLTTAAGPGVLAVLGLPLSRRDETAVRIESEWEGFHLALRISDLPSAPLLLWDSAELGQVENRR